MLGPRGAGLLGAAAAAAAAGGVAYLLWVYASSSRVGRAANQRGGGGAENDEARKGREEDEEQEESAAPKSPELRPASPPGTQVLVLGLDGAGKSSLLRYWATGSLEQDVHPSGGFNAVSISKGRLRVEVLEIGGREDLRPYWRRYLPRALLLVFVVDASCPQRFPVARQHLHQLLASRPCLPLMVLANKQDLPGAAGIADLHEALRLSEVGDRRLFLIGTQARKGQSGPCSGTRDAWDLLTQLLSDCG